MVRAGGAVGASKKRARPLPAGWQGVRPVADWRGANEFPGAGLQRGTSRRACGRIGPSRGRRPRAGLLRGCGLRQRFDGRHGRGRAGRGRARGARAAPADRALAQCRGRRFDRFLAYLARRRRHAQRGSSGRHAVRAPHRPRLRRRGTGGVGRCAARPGRAGCGARMELDRSQLPPRRRFLFLRPAGWMGRDGRIQRGGLRGRGDRFFPHAEAVGARARTALPCSRTRRAFLRAQSEAIHGLANHAPSGRLRVARQPRTARSLCVLV